MDTPIAPMTPAAPTLAALRAGIKQRSVDGLQLHPGQRVLDLGSGAGRDSLTLGHRVGAAGLVHGVDYDQRMVDRAQALALAEGVSGWVSHHHANATALPWPDGYFDACRCEAVLRHVLEPERALDEMLRVTRPGGHLVVLDIDWATLSIECGEPALERRLVQHHSQANEPNPYAGRRLAGLLHTRGLREIQIGVWPLWTTDPAEAEQIVPLQQLEDEALAAGVVDAAERQRWREGLARSGSSRRFYASVNAVLVSGRRP